MSGPLDTGSDRPAQVAQDHRVPMMGDERWRKSGGFVLLLLPGRATIPSDSSLKGAHSSIHPSDFPCLLQHNVSADSALVFPLSLVTYHLAARALSDSLTLLRFSSRRVLRAARFPPPLSITLPTAPKMLQPLPFGNSDLTRASRCSSTPSSHNNASLRSRHRLQPSPSPLANRPP